MTTRQIDLVVIGGSAGALEPLMQLVGSLPAELTAPIAIVLHLTPNQPSRIPALLAGSSARRVCEPEDKQALEPATVYVAPPNYHMLVERRGTIALSVDEPVKFSRPSIDVLFESAAEAFGDGVVGIVLSGTSSDGASGLRRVVEAGGIAIVQAPETAQQATMPAAALLQVPAATSRPVAAIAPHLRSLLDFSSELQQ